MLQILNYIIVFSSVQFFPKHGDLLFQDIDCGPLCEAIEQVTTGYNGCRFSHVGMVIKKDDDIFVIEAVGNGVLLTSLTDFLERSKDGFGKPKVIVGRIKPEYAFLINKAVSEAEKYVGMPYDNYFVFDNGSIYCSELIYLSFKAANNNSDFFSPEPMTFKTPGSDNFFHEWEDYYRNLNYSVPEGKPGINPGLISRSDKIEIVHIYGFPDGYLK